MGIGNEQEFVTIEIQTSEGEFIMINYYNLCWNLDLSSLLQIEGLDGRVIVCGDFNLHSTLWGGTDTNGEVIEKLFVRS